MSAGAIGWICRRDVRPTAASQRTGSSGRVYGKMIMLAGMVSGGLFLFHLETEVFFKFALVERFQVGLFPCDYTAFEELANVNVHGLHPLAAAALDEGFDLGCLGAPDQVAKSRGAEAVAAR